MYELLALIGALYVAFQIFNLITYLMLWQAKRTKKKIEKEAENKMKEFVKHWQAVDNNRIIKEAENIRDNYKVDEHE